jgi:hypothetical protein
MADETATPEEATEPTEEELARQWEEVHARYDGDTPVVMTDLANRDRCCQDENQREEAHEAWVATPPDERTGPDPHALLQKGDVIRLQRWSAEGRADFTVLEGSGTHTTAEAPAAAEVTIADEKPARRRRGDTETPPAEPAEQEE